jgi:hypothetical protein
MGQNARDNSATYSSQGISQRADNQSHSKIINFLQIISRIVTKLSLHDLLFVIIVDHIRDVMLRKNSRAPYCNISSSHLN